MEDNAIMYAHSLPYVLPEDYLEMERAASFKSKYYCGQIWAMSGASRKHDAIAINLTVAVAVALRGGACTPFTSDMRVDAVCANVSDAIKPVCA